MKGNVDFFVLIRFSGERTLDLCKKLIENSVPSACVQVTPVFPSFNDCFKYSIGKALEQNKSYTIFVDADILVRPGMILRLIKKFETLQKEYCTISSFTIDRYHLGKKSGGVHIYRTSALKLISMNLNQFIDEQRPETRAKTIMCEQYGLKIFQWDVVTCLHDFYQFKKDIIRKVSFRTIKSAHLASSYIMYYRKLRFYSSDYRLAYEVLLSPGINYNNKSSGENIDRSIFEFTEKSNLSSSFLYFLYKTDIPFVFWFYFFKILKRILK